MSLQTLYDRHILPHLIDVAMRAPMATHERSEIVPLATGKVLEIGVGSGLNMPFYDGGIEKLYALEPHEILRRKAELKARHVPFDVEFLGLSGEAIPLPEASIDSVVCTWVLCSIAKVHVALSEMHRVLKPGGRLLFVEHGRAPTPAVARWQDRMTPIWKHCAGGCRLNLRPDMLIQQAGFDMERLEKEDLGVPRLLTYHYKGIARRV